MASNEQELLSRVYTRQHVAFNMLLDTGNKIVASLLPVCCWI